MFNQSVTDLIKLAQSKGVQFEWVNSFTKVRGMQPAGMYVRHQGKRTIQIRKGMTLAQTEQIITHEIAHALWDLSLPTGKRGSLKKMKRNLGFLKSLMMRVLYHPDEWKEESFCYYMESRPSLLLHLFKQL